MAINWDEAPDGAVDIREGWSGRYFFTNGVNLYYHNTDWREMRFNNHDWPVIECRPLDWPETDERISAIAQNGGTGERSFKAAADAFNAATGKQLTGSDVCLVLAMVKMVRQYSSPDRLHHDSLLDGVSYMSLWAEELTKELGA